jgi:hypothetical protein
MGVVQQETRERQELADPPPIPANTSNIDLLNEMQRLREQMHAIEQRIRTESSTGAEEPPEYTKAP